MKYKDQIIKALDRIPMNNGTKNPDQSNLGGVLGEIYLWETIASLSSDRAKAGWKVLTGENLIKSKDDLREQVNGEQIIISSDKFVIHAKVSNPRSTFDKDKFIALAAKKFNLDKHKLVELAQTCTKETKAPLSLNVLEI